MDHINARVKTFGEAIVNLVDRLLPQGFDVGDDTPQTYAQLKALLDSGKRLLVWSGGCEQTIYTHPNINVAFRAWHDHCHWVGGYDFSLEGEIAACDLQCRQLLEHHGDNPVTRCWCALIRAEVIGQALYYQRHKRFPEDQRAFVAEYLIDPEPALLWPLW